MSDRDAVDAGVARGLPDARGPISGHELLLWLAGRVDDDLLAVGRELVAVGEEAAALELIVATLAAARTALPHRVRDGLVDLVERRLGPGPARMVPPGAPPADTAHRFVPDAGAPDAAELIARIVDGLAIVGRSGARTALAWRRTPAGAAPGPLPHPVVLLVLGDPAPAEVLAYQVGAALGRAGLAASVEVFVDGPAVPPYQRAALAAARALGTSDAPSAAVGPSTAADPSALDDLGRPGPDGDGPGPDGPSGDPGPSGDTDPSMSGWPPPPGADAGSGAPRHPTGIADTDPSAVARSRDEHHGAATQEPADRMPADPATPGSNPGAEQRVVPAPDGSGQDGYGTVGTTPYGSGSDGFEPFGSGTPRAAPGVTGPTGPAWADSVSPGTASTGEGPGVSTSDGSTPDDGDPLGSGTYRSTPIDPTEIESRPVGSSSDTPGSSGSTRTSAGSTPDGSGLPTPTPGDPPPSRSEPLPHRFGESAPTGSRPVEPPSAGSTAGPVRDRTAAVDPDPVPPVSGPDDGPTGGRRPGEAPGDASRPAGPGTSDGADGHPSPRPVPRRSARPGPRPATPGTGVATLGPDATGGRPDDPVGERAWAEQWSDGSWSTPGGTRSTPDPDKEPDTSPTPTSPPPSTVTPSPVRRTPVLPEDGSAASDESGPRHRLDALDPPRPPGTPPDAAAESPPSRPGPAPQAPEDVLDSRLTPSEQELLRRLQEELAARESGGGSDPAPRNGTGHPPDQPG